MDLYTTSFSFPQPSSRCIRTSTSPHHAPLGLPPSGSLNNVPLPNVTTATAPPRRNVTSVNITTAAQVERDWETVQKLAADITTREGCLVTVTRETIGLEQGSSPPIPTGSSDPDAPVQPSTVWNFYLSGPYQNVMSARGALLREVPRDNRVSLLVPRADVLESPLTMISALKPDVKIRLDDIAGESLAQIQVLNLPKRGSIAAGRTVLATVIPGSPEESTVPVNGQEPTSSATKRSSSGGSSARASLDIIDENGQPRSAAGTTETSPTKGGLVSYGLETERMCEVVLSGSIESVEIAKVRILVMLDELSGLHSEVCDIDYKLHGIIACRKRSAIQSIQEETATNIYFPTQLVGVLNAPQPGSRQGVGYRDVNLPPQHTGMGPHMTGLQSMHTGMSMANNGHGHGDPPHLAVHSQATGGMHMHQPPHQQQHHMGGFHPPPGVRQTNGPAYNPHQHVQYPYSPQPMDINSHTPRGVPFNGPAMQHYGQMGSPLPMNHTGLSYPNVQPPPGGLHDRNLGSPLPMHPPHLSPTPHHAHGLPPPHHTMSPPPPHHHMGGPMGMNHNGMSMPYQHTGQSHMHVGLGAMHTGLSTMNGMPGGVGMQITGMHPPPMGMGQFGAGPHPGLSVHGGEQGVLGKANQIWITGEFFGVQRARDMLLNLAVQKSRLVISRDTAILPRKLDWLLTERVDEVKQVMNDNGTYIQAPSVGSQASLITVFGDHRVNIERTIRSLMALTCQFYIASFWLLPVAFDVLMPSASLNAAQMQPILKRISHATGAEVVFKSNCFEMHGLEHEVRAAVLMVMDLDVVQGFHHEIRFQIELANDHRDFISGKKNGKINKIMKMSLVKIKFETFNDYNFLIDLSGNGPGALQGLSMLQEELPAEVSFHVPETYHKRIIGVGGKNIQRIMKLFGVYVKFSNAEEFAALGGYIDNEDNVVARTPAKNAISLESLKQSVMELVNPKDKDYTSESVSIPRRYHRTLLGEKAIFIHDIEAKTNSSVHFPYKETASDLVTIFGPESQVAIAAAMLLDHVPFEADLHVPPNPDLGTLVTSQEFLLFTEKVKRDHQIAIAPSARFGQGDETVFKFQCQRSNIDFLSTARDALEEFLGQHNIQVYPSNAQRRVDSFTDAFSHFNSKLLSTSANPEDNENLLDRRPRPATSASDVRALFDGTVQPSQSHQHIPGHQSFRSVDESGAFGYPFGFAGTRPVGEPWQQPGGPTPARTESEASKRDSDPILQEKVRQMPGGPGPHQQPRMVSNRTQSLDITSLNFARREIGQMGTIGQGAVTASPNTSTGQYFPHAVPPPQSTSMYMDSALEGVTQGMNSIQVSHP